MRRTRRGLLLTALGLMLSWIPFVSAVGALLLSLGSTFLFLGARGAGRRHEIAVVLAFLVLAIGGVAIGFLLGTFLLQAYDAAFAGRPFSTLRDAASLLVWATLPATVAVASGFGLQVVALLPPRRQRVLLGLCALLVASAVAATWLSDPEVAALGPVRVTYGSVSEFLLRLSLYRMVEAPAYIGLGLLYLATYLDTSLAGRFPRLPAARPEEA
ncbi:MAG TPA: hypothetical protein VEM95_06435 [Thermoplasmata archaeon]|nr:hypothetical protein [Thermoplasmata archaeon]